MNTTTPHKKSLPASSTGLTAEQLAAKLYHHSLPDWAGEFDFYRGQACETASLGPLLEVACGTGRIAIDLAQQGRQVTGFDLSPEMLAIARQMSTGMQNVHWEAADMRSFDMGERFGLALIPGHSFQFMLTPADQLACLDAIRRHLLPGGRLVIHLDHQDLGWLWKQYQGKGDVLEQVRQLPHPEYGNPLTVYRAWAYEPSSQTASVRTVWEELDAQGNMLQRWERGPVAMHCIFRFEMEHLLARAGFTVKALYGNFEYAPLQDDSSEMVWVSEIRKDI